MKKENELSSKKKQKRILKSFDSKWSEINFQELDINSLIYNFRYEKEKWINILNEDKIFINLCKNLIPILKIYLNKKSKKTEIKLRKILSDDILRQYAIIQKNAYDEKKEFEKYGISNWGDIDSYILLNVLKNIDVYSNDRHFTSYENKINMILSISKHLKMNPELMRLINYSYEGLEKTLINEKVKVLDDLILEKRKHIKSKKEFIKQIKILKIDFSVKKSSISKLTTEIEELRDEIKTAKAKYPIEFILESCKTDYKIWTKYIPQIENYAEKKIKGKEKIQDYISRDILNNNIEPRSVLTTIRRFYKKIRLEKKRQIVA